MFGAKCSLSDLVQGITISSITISKSITIHSIYCCFIPYDTDVLPSSRMHSEYVLMCNRFRRVKHIYVMMKPEETDIAAKLTRRSALSTFNSIKTISSNRHALASMH